MNEENAKQLVKDVVEEDKIVHEYQLGLSYQESNLYVCFYYEYLFSSLLSSFLSNSFVSQQHHT